MHVLPICLCLSPTVDQVKFDPVRRKETEPYHDLVSACSKTHTSTHIHTLFVWCVRACPLINSDTLPLPIFWLTRQPHRHLTNFSHEIILCENNHHHITASHCQPPTASLTFPASQFQLKLCVHVNGHFYLWPSHLIADYCMMVKPDYIDVIYQFLQHHDLPKTINLINRGTKLQAIVTSVTSSKYERGEWLTHCLFLYHCNIIKTDHFS